MNENPKLQTIELQREKIAKYIHIPEDSLKIGREGYDLAREELTACLTGWIYTASKSTGEIAVYVPPPSFLDWLFKRSRTATAKYEVRHLVDPNTIRIPKDKNPTIIVNTSNL